MRILAVVTKHVSHACSPTRTGPAPHVALDSGSPDNGKPATMENIMPRNEHIGRLTHPLDQEAVCQ